MRMESATSERLIEAHFGSFLSNLLRMMMKCPIFFRRIISNRALKTLPVFSKRIYFTKNHRFRNSNFSRGHNPSLSGLVEKFTADY